MGFLMLISWNYLGIRGFTDEEWLILVSMVNMIDHMVSNTVKLNDGYLMINIIGDDLPTHQPGC